MNILKYAEGICQPACGIRTTDPEAYKLQLGQYWEEVVATALTKNELPAYRPEQQFIDRWELQEWRERGRCRLRTCAYDSKRILPGCRAFKGDLLRSHQRDVLVKVGKVKRLSVEVKALCPKAFQKPSIWVGCTPKWDEKMFKVDALILINQDTGEAFAAPNQEHWQRATGWDGKLAYAVPRHLLTPLEAWIDYIKDSYGLS
jgi:hypothetical protein